MPITRPYHRPENATPGHENADRTNAGRPRPETDEAVANRQTASLAGMAVTLAVIVACLFLAKQLHQKTAVEDCLMAGRTNCDLVLTRAR